MTWEEKARAIIDQHHQLKLGTRNALVLEFADALRSAYERGIGDERRAREAERIRRNEEAEREADAREG